MGGFVPIIIRFLAVFSVCCLAIHRLWRQANVPPRKLAGPMIFLGVLTALIAHFDLAYKALRLLADRATLTVSDLLALLGCLVVLAYRIFGREITSSHRRTTKSPTNVPRSHPKPRPRYSYGVESDSRDSDEVTDHLLGRRHASASVSRRRHNHQQKQRHVSQPTSTPFSANPAPRPAKVDLNMPHSTLRRDERRTEYRSTTPEPGYRRAFQTAAPESHQHFTSAPSTRSPMYHALHESLASPVAPSVTESVPPHAHHSSSQQHPWPLEQPITPTMQSDHCSCPTFLASADIHSMHTPPVRPAPPPEPHFTVNARPELYFTANAPPPVDSSPPDYYASQDTFKAQYVQDGMDIDEEKMKIDEVDAQMPATTAMEEEEDAEVMDIQDSPPSWPVPLSPSHDPASPSAPSGLQSHSGLFSNKAEAEYQTKRFSSPTQRGSRSPSPFRCFAPWCRGSLCCGAEAGTRTFAHSRRSGSSHQPKDNLTNSNYSA